MAEPVARFDNTLLLRGDPVETRPGTTYATAAEAEVAAQRVARGDQDAVVVFDGERYRVDVMDEVANLPRGRFGSNELYGAQRNVAAFFTGRGDAVALRGTRDGTTMVDTVASVFQRAGVSETEARDLATRGISPERAREVFGRIMERNGSLRDFGPRITALRMLQTAAGRDQPTSALELAGDAHRYAPINVVRPDGYVARMTTGEALFRAGEPAIRDDQWVAGQHQVGQLLHDSGGVYREVDANLRPGAIVGEHPLQGIAVLDGATDATAAMLAGAYNLVAHPVRTAEGLLQLPARLREGISDLPGGMERFMAMSGHDQVRALSNVLTTGAFTIAGVTAIARAGRVAAGNIGNLTLPGGPTPAFAVVGGGRMTAGAATIGTEAASALTAQAAGIAAGTFVGAQVDGGLTVMNSRADGLGGGGNEAPKWQSRPAYGHTFEQHGAKVKTRDLIGRANGPRGGPQGQWLDNDVAARFLWGDNVRALWNKLRVGTEVEMPLPEGLGQVVRTDGIIVPATHVRIIRGPTGIRTAYPVVLPP